MHADDLDSLHTADLNRRVAARLDEAAALLHEQGADRFRVNAYHRAADTVRRWPQSVHAVLQAEGMAGLERLPGVGPAIARAIRELVQRGRLPMLDRLRGAGDPESVLATLPGIGRQLAERLHVELGIGSLEDLEAAAYDRRLEQASGFGPKRLEGIRNSLAQRLGRIRSAPSPGADSTVAEILDVDREYRARAAAGTLRVIAPRRFNPQRRAWLPILHTERGDRRYTALFSNTARAHQFGKTNDWVVVYRDDDGAESQFTVITAERGPLRGQRIVVGRHDDERQSAA